MKALQAGYGELTPKKVSGIVNSLTLKKGMEVKPTSIEGIIHKTTNLTTFVLGNHLEAIKPEMHQL